ncbi:FAR1-related sequence 10 [Arabidopsis thaliana]|uniref:Protein FAR1-RELATED SEQUENCE n=1 Tax=Arabidopsis thaliana TaxID=3702 RepID=A0A1P8BEH3_ARATH|nr:FAR1-related sequence 10 [Arabidopsis thaliana]ANM69990.1 FAR1-related sequence 10 [Arabidopsis thaliana]|eukprot:NP_001331634.1 FAR1-related sequence 10 [Arabidopsis thaliana]
MALKPLNNIWIRRQQCPCGDWKCYIRLEEDESTITKSEIESTPTPTSQYDTVFTPYVGQIFTTDDEAFEYYSTFARKSGFSIRKARSTESQNLGVYRRDFVCYRSGFNQPRKKANVEHPRERKSVRCGCDGKLYLTKEVVDGVSHWYVSQFSNVHNHELLEDDQVRLLPAYRKIQQSDQERILLLSKAGFPVNRIVKLLELEKGVVSGQLPFIEKDVRNFVRACKKSVQENDAFMTEKRESDTLELLECCKDNNGKAMLLGCVLLQDESCRSFTWALQTFVRFMRGRHPQTILTDIDTGLKDAIGREMPNTNHVVFMSHIVSKLASWFSQTLGSHYEEFRAGFDMLCRAGNVDEFEQQWDLLVTRFGLVPDRHAALLYSCRASWLPCCIREHFVAQTMTSEFNLSIDSFLKRVVDGATCMQLLLEESALQVSAAASLAKQILPRFTYPSLKTCMPMEDHARGILTPYAFSVLQNEMVLSVQYAVAEMANGPFIVHHYKKMEGECCVIWNPENEEIQCSCKEFEHSGILCRHTLRVLTVKNCFHIPEQYFLLRWRQESPHVATENQNGQGIGDDSAQTFHSLTETLLTESMISKDRLDYANQELSLLIDRVRNTAPANCLYQP